jgi:hypothetical protein
MIDPAQDRLMVHRMAYFRLKRRALGRAYERFLLEHLAEGGTIFVVDGRFDWPTSRVGERHLLQFGALGGPTEDEYQRGGPRVASFLAKEGASRSAWDPPPADGRSPEAEWGYDDRLTEDVARVAARGGFRVRRLQFEHPEHVSPLVADLFTEWNARRGIAAQRLLVSSFILLDPTLTIRAGATPFWIVFNNEPSDVALASYLGARPPFDTIDMTLFSHGVTSIGVVPLERWAALRGRAHAGGALLGVDPRTFPKDFGNLMRYHRDIAKTLPRQGAAPEPLALDAMVRFLEARAEGYGARLLDK